MNLQEAFIKVQANTGQAPDGLLCGPDFLISYCRHQGHYSGFTDQEILDKFKDCWCSGYGCYYLKGMP